MDKMAAVVLAAGQGTRMRSDRPKVLHRLLGRPLVQFPIDLARRIGSEPIVIVVGHGREMVEETVRALPGGDKASFAHQVEQLGTGHAVMSALPKLNKLKKGTVLILSGDVPLLDKASVTKLKKAYDKSGGPLALLTFCPPNPHGYGRMIRNEKGQVVDIREHRDCTRAEKAIAEVNAGIYLIDIAFVRRHVKKLKDNNDQKEFYLTDLVKIAAGKGSVAAVEVATERVSGINDRVDLAQIEAVLQEQTNLAFLRSGVTIRQKESVHIDLNAKVGLDTELGPGVQLLGNTRIGRGCRIEAGAIITDSIVENGAWIKAYSVLENAVVKPGAHVGPMGRLRPGTVVCEGARVGNFVELKNTVLGPGSKASHLAYLGDGKIGERVNIGAGTIFCNYDGFSKHQTVLEDDVFIGSDSQLVAPITVGSGSYVASGSTVTKDVPADTLAIARTRQSNKLGRASFLRLFLKEKKEKALKKRAAKKKKMDHSK